MHYSFTLKLEKHARSELEYGLIKSPFLPVLDGFVQGKGETAVIIS